ncbi:hypothetical protein GCM10023350_25110 [Nocardioides endophyticus]|uniref:Uncharacterized protein n=1 Tax=Nocardioides endophyticus TaxID=1353775 RepID=A0ABP8YWW1_9ACTN
MGVQRHNRVLTCGNAWRTFSGFGGPRWLGQHWGNKTDSRAPLLGHCSGCVHGIADLVEAVVEQVTVGVQGHRRGGVAEHLLDDLHVRAAGDGETGGGVAELVWVQARDADGPSSRTELFAERAHPRRLSAPECAEDELVGSLVRDVTLKLINQEGWDRDLAALVGLGRSPDPGRDPGPRSLTR